MGGVCGIGSIKGRLSPIGSLQGALSIPVGGGLDCDIYEGEYNITPSDTVQVLPTANKLLKHDIVIDGKAAQATVDTLVGADTGKSVRIPESLYAPSLLRKSQRSWLVPTSLTTP